MWESCHPFSVGGDSCPASSPRMMLCWCGIPQSEQVAAETPFWERRLQIEMLRNLYKELLLCPVPVTAWIECLMNAKVKVIKCPMRQPLADPPHRKGCFFTSCSFGRCLLNSRCNLHAPVWLTPLRTEGRVVCLCSTVTMTKLIAQSSRCALTVRPSQAPEGGTTIHPILQARELRHRSRLGIKERTFVSVPDHTWFSSLAGGYTHPFLFMAILGIG